MIHLDEYRDSRAVQGLLRRIEAETQGRPQVTFMEVCGTHTMAAARYGIRSMLSEKVKLLSGPGCPVCVTPSAYIDRAIAISRRGDCTVATFGDMFRVPGSTSSLAREKSLGADIRIVYSPTESLDMAVENPERSVIFLGIGFETTAPTVAAIILAAEEKGLKNWFVLSGHKTIPGAMGMLASSPDLAIDGFLCPGHVSAIIGWWSYEPIVREHGIPCVVAGFEPTDILQAIWMLSRQCREGRSVVENQYARVVEKRGNQKAVLTMQRTFEPGDSEWRGIGVVPGSGLTVRGEFGRFDARRSIAVDVEKTREVSGCICGEVLKGLKTPVECSLFGGECTPSDPKGACMVSSEGTCAAYYKYRNCENPEI